MLKKGLPYKADEDVNRWKLARMYEPINLQGKDSEEIEYDKRYEKVKLLIAQKTNIDVRSLTVFQYYAYLETVYEQIHEEQNHYKRIKK